MSFIPGRILAKRAASPTVTLLDLSIPSLTFAPGQWLDFCIPTADWIGGFSIASGPSPSAIQIAVKESTHPPAHWVTHDSQVGDTVIVKVGGTCLLHSEQQHPAIMIAGGIGISPVLGLYRQHVIEKRPPVKFFYSVSTEEEVVFRNELEQLIRPNDHLTITLTQSNTWNQQQQSPPNNIDYQVGRTMTAFLKETLLPDNAIYYVCGPPSMQDEALETLRSHHVAPDRLVYEKWW